MNIEALAREAGMLRDGNCWFSESSSAEDVEHADLERFADLVLEEAARLIDQTWQKTPAEYAAAIRALKAAPGSPASPTAG